VRGKRPRLKSFAFSEAAPHLNRNLDIAVYDGRAPLGHIVETPGSGIGATLADGSDPGRFPTVREASQAILEAVRAAR